MRQVIKHRDIRLLSMIRRTDPVIPLSNLLQTDDATGKLTGQRGVETCLHKELATEGLALEAMAALCALKLVEAIGGAFD